MQLGLVLDGFTRNEMLFDVAQGGSFYCLDKLSLLTSRPCATDPCDYSPFHFNFPLPLSEHFPLAGRAIKRRVVNHLKIRNQPKTPQEYREKWKKVRPQGKVAIVIDEDGHVSEAKVLEASPKEASDALLTMAKAITFKPRPGCGTFKTEMVFSLNQ